MLRTLYCKVHLPTATVHTSHILWLRQAACVPIRTYVYCPLYVDIFSFSSKHAAPMSMIHLLYCTVQYTLWSTVHRGSMPEFATEPSWAGHERERGESAEGGDCKIVPDVWKTRGGGGGKGGEETHKEVMAAAPKKHQSASEKQVELACRKWLELQNGTVSHLHGIWKKIIA